jgi:hypothetical protein
MSEQLQSGLHLDPDSLNAFIEGVLPEHERLQCLAHLGECSQCRQVVFLAREHQPAPAGSNPIPVWRRWFAPVPALSAAAGACMVVLVVLLYLNYMTRPPARDLVARARQSSPVPAPPYPKIPTEAQTATRRPTAKKNSARVAQPAAVLPAGRGTISATTPTMVPPTLPPPPSIRTQPDNVQNKQAALPPASLSAIPPPERSPSVNIENEQAPADGLSGIKGTVTDSSGSFISGATVTLRQLAGTFNANTRTDVLGKFTLTGLPEGRYELQVAASGFRQTSTHIDLQPREVANVTSELAIGLVAETVEVTAASPTIQTSASTTSREPRRKSASPAEPRQLPSKLPATITVTSGKVMLAVDSAGALFLSQNAGKRWKAIKPVWPGKVVRLVTVAEPPRTSTAAFQLNTDSDSAWVSQDGIHWYPAPAQH